MGIFNKLARLVKREKTEEQKLLIDLKKARKLIKIAYKKAGFRIYVGRLSSKPTLNSEEFDQFLLELIDGALSWLKEARKRIKLIGKNLEQQKIIKGYRKSTKLNKKDEVLLIQFNNNDTILRDCIKELNQSKKTVILKRETAWPLKSVLEQITASIRNLNYYLYEYETNH